jgi:hypothetical protein
MRKVTATRGRGTMRKFCNHSGASGLRCGRESIIRLTGDVCPYAYGQSVTDYAGIFFSHSSRIVSMDAAVLSTGVSGSMVLVVLML